jgi:5-methylcytosine-specific restriction protein A
VSLSETIQKILAGYSSAKSEEFTAHPLGAVLRTEMPSELRTIISGLSQYDYLLKGSAGQGQWVASPWVAILDPLVTDTPQRGYYPVYLFREDLSGLYLSLNQGVTEPRAKYHSNVKDALRARAADFRARIGEIPKEFPEKVIDLRTPSGSSYASDYEAGNICAKFYDAAAVPDDEVLIQDLAVILRHYSVLSDAESEPTGNIGIEDDEVGNPFIENYAQMRQHKRIERNQKIAKAVKQALGFTCQACQFRFKAFYPGVEKNEYIEAHHLVPISQLKGKILKRDPKKDFAVLCSNCHRMIHRTPEPWNLAAFRDLLAMKAL